MKKITFILISLVGIFALAQVVPAPSPVPVAAPSFIDTLLAHKVDLAAFVYWFLDIVIWAIPSLQANGLLHQVQLWASALSGQSKQA